MRLGGLIVVVWLAIGLFATYQRGYLVGSDASCAKLATVLVTVAAGPLNYFGVNPTIECVVPQPSP